MFGVLTLYASACIAGELDAYIKSETEVERMNQLIILNEIKGDEAMSVAENTIKNLKSNLNFIEKISHNSNYRECVVVQEYIKGLKQKSISVKQMRKTGKISKKQYERHTDKLERSLNNLLKKENKLCTNKGER